MEKIFSKINKKKLLHIISKKLPEDTKRQDLTEIEKPLQVSRVNLKNTVIKPHSNNPKSLNSGLVEQNECWIVLSGIINITLISLSVISVAAVALSRFKARRLAKQA